MVRYVQWHKHVNILVEYGFLYRGVEKPSCEYITFQSLFIKNVPLLITRGLFSPGEVAKVKIVLLEERTNRHE